MGKLPSRTIQTKYRNGYTVEGRKGRSGDVRNDTGLIMAATLEFIHANLSMKVEEAMSVLHGLKLALDALRVVELVPNQTYRS
ncbi:hypothetical protein ACOSQ4_011539 [Xanthoceras sorbifolium]